MFKKGNTLGKGRPKGSPDKKTKELRSFINDLIDDNRETLQSDLNEMQPKERVDAIIRLMEFALPKLNRTELDGNFKNSVVISLVDDTNLKLNNYEQSN